MVEISVILPVYNSEQYIKDCVDSILNQTFSNFELIIIDDCSTDKSISIIESLSDKRIRFFKKELNTGYTESLSWGIKEAKGAFIARMDSDDLCDPLRFIKQLDFLKSNPDVALCGTDAKIIGANFDFGYPEEYEKIKINLLFGSSLIHPSIMGKRDVFLKYSYDKSLEPAEDYDLFTRIALAEKICNLPEKLLSYRVHNTQVSKTRSQIQQAHMRSSMLRMFKVFDYDRKGYTDEELLNAVMPFRSIDLKEFNKVINWFESLPALDKNSFYDKSHLIKAIKRKQYNLIKYYLENPSERIDFGPELMIFKMFNLNIKWTVKYFKNKYLGLSL